MASRKITNKKELPHNAKILHPDGKWRDKRGRLTKKPLDEPSYKYDGTSYTKFSPTIKPRKKPKKKRKETKKALKERIKELEKEVAEVRKKPRRPEVTEPLGQRLYKPATLAQLLGQRNLKPGLSQDIAAGIQEATARDIENRMLIASRALEDVGLSSGIKLTSYPDPTINAELTIILKPGISIREVFDLLKQHLTYPPTVYASMGFRFTELGDKIRISFPTVSGKTGDVVASKKSKLDAYQAQSGYMQTDRALRNIWEFGEKFLFKIYSKDNKPHKPREIFVRMHWNPFVDDEGKPMAPTRQE